MRSRFALTAAVLSSAALLATGAVAAQTAAGSAAPADPQAQMKAQMDAYNKLTTPGEHHKRLGMLAGKWKVSGKAWMVPGQPPMEMASTMEASWILGGHYMQETYSGSFMGQPFEGRQTDGYDNGTNEYFATWVDSMGTGLLVSRGTCDDPCKVLTETGDELDPMTGKIKKTKSVTTFIDNDTYRVEMYTVGAGPGGQDFKQMEMNAKRVH
jgi:hypothetical protein